jgi:hypothetical protein
LGNYSEGISYVKCTCPEGMHLIYLMVTLLLLSPGKKNLLNERAVDELLLPRKDKR